MNQQSLQSSADSCDLYLVNYRAGPHYRFFFFFTITSKGNALPHCIACLQLHPWSHKVLIIHPEIVEFTFLTIKDVGLLTSALTDVN